MFGLSGRHLQPCEGACGMDADFRSDLKKKTRPLMLAEPISNLPQNVSLFLFSFVFFFYNKLYGMHRRSRKKNSSSFDVRKRFQCTLLHSRMNMAIIVLFCL